MHMKTIALSPKATMFWLVNSNASKNACYVIVNMNRSTLISLGFTQSEMNMIEYSG